MRVSLNWLSSLIELPATDELVARLIETGTAVEHVDRVGNELAHVVVGHVLTCEDHPDSDHLHVATVDVGAAEPLQIVCGAPNVAPGQKVPVACVGAVLPGDFAIKKSKLRGVESCGMICSSRELALDDEHEGIMVLDGNAEVGMSIADYLGQADTILHCEITPNRPDCLNMEGFAREVGAIFSRDSFLELPVVKEEVKPASADMITVEIADGERCPYYSAFLAEDVKLGPSPAWMQEYLRAVGCRPINNVVDITNYVLFLLGQPLHAFDAKKLSVDAEGKRHIVVRTARDGEQLVTLDEVERVLTSDMTVIADGGERPIALAGVMGGLDTEVTEATTSVLLEAALFDPGSTSRTSRDLNLISESSLRYERGVDPAGVERASKLAAALLEEYAGATIHAGVASERAKEYMRAEITFRPDRARAVIGAPVENDFMYEKFEALGCEIILDGSGAESWLVIAPTFRPDLTRECDLIEEVTRLWGMDKVEPRIPAAFDAAGGLTREQHLLRVIKDQLTASGLYETSTYCFATDGDMQKVNAGSDSAADGEPSYVEIVNPLTADQGRMRRSILPGLLRSVAYNLDHGTGDVALFEADRVFFPHEDRAELPEEPMRISAVVTGAREPQRWDSAPTPYDFYDLKGAIENLAKMLHLKVRFRERKDFGDDAENAWPQPGRVCEVLVGKRAVGFLGNVHPLVLAQFGISAEVVAFELELEPILEAACEVAKIEAVPQFPAVVEDLAIVVSEEQPYQEIAQRIKSAGGKYLESLELFDVYRDVERVGAGKKSMAFTCTFRAPDKSLTQEEVSASMEKLVRKIESGLGAQVRS